MPTVCQAYWICFSLLEADVFVQLLTLAFMVATIFVYPRMHKDNLEQGRIYLNVIYFYTFFYIVNGYTESSITVSTCPALPLLFALASCLNIYNIILQCQVIV